MGQLWDQLSRDEIMQCHFNHDVALLSLRSGVSGLLYFQSGQLRLATAEAAEAGLLKGQTKLEWHLSQVGPKKFESLKK